MKHKQLKTLSQPSEQATAGQVVRVKAVKSLHDEARGPIGRAQAGHVQTTVQSFQTVWMCELREV